MKKQSFIASSRWFTVLSALIATGWCSVLAADVSGDRLNIGPSHTLSGAKATIAGGSNNTASALFSAVGGGSINSVSGTNSVIGGGSENINSATGGTIAGGYENNLTGTGGAIGGGYENTNSGGYAVIGGGYQNLQKDETGFIGGGYGNVDEGRYGAIAGGYYNLLRTNANGYGAGFIGGGGYNTNLAAYSAISGGYGNRLDSGDYGFIGAGENNTNSGAHSTLGGGQLNFISATAELSVLSGGDQNWISGGIGTIGGGSYNTIHSNSANSVIAGGFFNSTTNDFTVVGGGYGNSSSAVGSTIPGGREASATKYGQLAYASGAFANAGDAQSSLFVLRRATSNGTQTELFLDNSSSRMTVPSGTTWAFEIWVAGRSSANTSAGYHMNGVIDNNGGTTSFVGSPTITTLAEDVAGWDATVEADNGNDALVIKVTGAASTNMRWVATVRTTEVSY